MVQEKAPQDERERSVDCVGSNRPAAKVLVAAHLGPDEERQVRAVGHAECDRRHAFPGGRYQQVVEIGDRDVPATRGEALHLHDRGRRDFHGHVQVLGLEEPVRGGDFKGRVADERDDADRGELSARP